MNETDKLIVDFYKNASYMKWNQFYNKNNLLSITKMDRKEDSHTQIIKYILDPNEQHGLGTRPLELFLRLLVIKNTNKNTVKENKEKFLVKSTNLNVIMIGTEKTDRDAIYDIYIKFTMGEIEFNVFIENKVLSTENQNQTIKYTENAKEYLNPILVYLSNNDTCESKDFMCITYQDLLDYIIEPLYNETDNITTKQMLKDYMRVLSHIETKERSVTLAMSSEEKQLLRNVFSENQKLFDKMIESLTDNEVTKEERDIYKKAIEINKNRRAKWIYKGQSMTSKDLVLTIVKEQLQMGNSVEKLSELKMHSDPLVVLEEKTKDDGYTKQELEELGLTYYVRTCCDKKDVLKLIEKLKVEEVYQ